MRRQLIILTVIGLLCSPLLFAKQAKGRSYVKEYFANGNLKAEGWQQYNQKTDYWIFYNPNGTLAAKGHYSQDQRNGYWYFYSVNGHLEKEGHFVRDSAEDWWIFYEIGNSKKSKFQYKNDQKHGYALRYRNNKLIKAEKYQHDQKMGEWDSIREFKRDNPEASLR